MWKFYCYDDGRNPDLWASWYAGDADERDRAQHDQVFDVLVGTERWIDPPVKSLGGGLLEIKIRGTLQWRIFGFYYPSQQRKVFTLLLFCYHKQNRYYPRQNCIAIARQRLKAIKKGFIGVKNSVRPR